MRVFRQKYRDRKGKLRESRKWYVEFKDHHETRRRLPGFTDKAATKELGRRIEQFVAVRINGDTPGPELSKWLELLPNSTRDRLGKFGLLDSRSVANRKPLAEHLEDYERHLNAKDNNERYVRETIGLVRAIASACKFHWISEINASAVEVWLAGRRKEGMGISTSNHYLTAIKGFCKWLIADSRASENPLAHLSRLNGDTDVRRVRRALSAEEFAQLIDTTQTMTTNFRGLTGLDRAVLYLMAATTGLRVSELASLRESSLDLNDLEPTVTVDAAYSKRRREDVLPLHTNVAAILLLWRRKRAEQASRETRAGLSIDCSTKLWPGTWHEKAAKMLRMDLGAARERWIEDAENKQELERRKSTGCLLYRNANGVADFHALRHTFITNLAQSGVHPKVAQQLARHSTITLTMDRYSHVERSVMHEAVQSLSDLPELSLAPPQHVDPISVLPLCLPKADAGQDTSVHRPALSDDAEDQSARIEEPCTTRAKRHYSGDLGARVTDGIRTRDPQNHNLVL